MTRHWWAGLTAVPMILLATVLAGCAAAADDGGGVATAGRTSAGPSASPTVAADEEERRQQFIDCMQAEGVEVEVEGDAGSGKSGIRARQGQDGNSDMKAAMEKCRQFMPNGGEAPKLSAEDIEKMREYAACMRANGVPNFPDPDPETGGIKIESQPGDGLDKDSLKEAEEKCKDKQPNIGGAKGGK